MHTELALALWQFRDCPKRYFLQKTQTCHDGSSRTLFSWTLQKPRPWFSAQVSGCHKSTDHKVSASPTTSNCSEDAGLNTVFSTSTSSMSLACITTTSVHCVICDHCWHWIQPKLRLLLLLAVNSDWTTAALCCIQCRNQTLTGYSACKTF